MKKALLILLSVSLVCVFSATTLYAVEKGGTFNWIAPYGSSVSSLDPNASDDEQNELVCINIHRGLYKWDAATNTPKLEVAASVSSSPDGLVYTYKLKDNVKFHNGRQLTVDDVIYTYNRIMNPANAFGASGLLKVIKGADDVFNGKADTIAGLKKIDDLTLEITMELPVDPAYALFKVNTAIVPREAVEDKVNPFGSNPIGCGPFKFVKWVKGSEIVLEKFGDFYEAGKPYLDTLVYKIMGDSAARDIAFRAKELDANILYSSQYAAYSVDSELSKRLIEVAEMYTRMIAFNREYTLADGRKPFEDKRVRQAFNYAIDSDLIIKKFQKNKAYPAISFLAPTTPGFDPAAQRYTYNPALAKKLMQEAGYADGFPLEIVGTDSDSYGTGAVEVIIPFLKEIGIQVKPVTLEGAAKYERQKNGDFQAIIGSLPSGPDPIQSLWRFHSSTDRASRNTPAFNNPQFDQYLEAAAAERTDMVKRLDYVKKANDLFREEAPIWFFNYNKAIIAYQPWVHGIQAVGPEMMFQDFTEVWVESSSPRAK